MPSFMTPRLIRKKHKKSIFLKKAGFLGQSQNTFGYFLLTQLLENELEIMHVEWSSD